MKNPNELIVSISKPQVPMVRGFGDLGVVATKTALISDLRKLGVAKIHGIDTWRSQQAHRVDLHGVRGVKHHIEKPDAYVFFGKPTLDELFKLASLIVATQTLDPNLHFFNEAGIKTRKPIIVYGDPEHFLPFFEIMQRFHSMGTLRQEPESLIRFAANGNELAAQLHRQIPADTYVHKKAEVDEKRAAEIEAQIADRTFFDHDFGIVEPKFKVVAYTSARVENQAGYDLGKAFAEAGIGGVSGAGKVGNMGAFSRGVHENGGWNFGVNCPHIVRHEGLPEKMIVKLSPDIYVRMADMKAAGHAVVVGAGGVGGVGTLQEAFAAALLIQRNDPLMRIGTNGNSRQKALIIDRSLGAFNGLEAMLAEHGLCEGVHFCFANGNQEIMQTLDAFRLEELNFGDRASRWPVNLR